MQELKIGNCNPAASKKTDAAIDRNGIREQNSLHIDVATTPIKHGIPKTNHFCSGYSSGRQCVSAPKKSFFSGNIELLFLRLDGDAATNDECMRLGRAVQSVSSFFSTQTSG